MRRKPGAKLVEVAGFEGERVTLPVAKGRPDLVLLHCRIAHRVRVAVSHAVADDVREGRLSGVPQREQDRRQDILQSGEALLPVNDVEHINTNQVRIPLIVTGDSGGP